MERPNILFLMTDQCQAAVIEPDHPCRTPNLDRLASRGLRFNRAYTPNAICSPARTSLMTGLLPHNHGVLTVTHTVDEDQSVLRKDAPHWAQRLESVGYRRGYFGKTHIERSGNFGQFGWDVCIEQSDPLVRERVQKYLEKSPDRWTLDYGLDHPIGYPSSRFYGATDRSDQASLGSVVCEFASEYLEQVLGGPDPWCCFVSLTEPHDPFVCTSATLAEYDIDALPLPPEDDSLRPGLYRKAARIFEKMTPRHRREAAACYYASITELDRWFGRLIDQVEAAGALDNTVIIFTTDHGELLGAHGLYCKNIGGYEEIYRIPLIMSGPGITQGETDARVGLHDLAPTLTDLGSAEPMPPTADSRSFVSVLESPESTADNFRDGYAEYHGGRYLLTQRIVWEDHWKLIFNGFDFDELYDLDNDPNELNNLIDRPECQEISKQLHKKLWAKLDETGDHSLARSAYPILRLATYGPKT